MTRQEAIQYLSPIAESAALPRYKEALGMAIAALKEKDSKGVEIDAFKNDPLTLEELRAMDAPVWCVCKPLEGGNGYWCLCKTGTIITPAGSSYDVAEIPHWHFLCYKPGVME